MNEDNHSFIDTPIELGTGKGFIVKEKKTIFQAIQEKLNKDKPINQPATEQDIKQLKLELEKAKLEKELALTKASIPKQVHPIVKVLKALAENEAKAKKKKPKFTI